MKMLSNVWQEIIAFYNGDVLSLDVGFNHWLVECDIEFSLYFNPQISIRSREKIASELQLKIHVKKRIFSWISPATCPPFFHYAKGHIWQSVISYELNIVDATE